MLIIHYVEVRISTSSSIQDGIVLVIHMPAHLLEILVIGIFWISDVEVSAAYPPAKARIIISMNQDHRTLWPGLSEKVYLCCEHVALDDPNTALRMPCPGSIKLCFAHALAVLVKLIKPCTKLHARIPVCTQMHEIHVAAGIMIVGACFAVISTINVWAMIDVLDHAAPLAARSTCYEDVFHVIPCLSKVV